jgi:hypothetical protein
MIDMQKVVSNKEKILSVLRFKGPSLPVQIAREIEFSPLFASAFLSELKSEGKINLSNMRVGSSPLYYLPGHEAQLEKFVAYLNQREKEAFELLKKEQVLEDSEQTPVMRVALRAIKDFAVPIKIRVNGEGKLYWKYFTLPEGEIEKVLTGKNEDLPKVKEAPPVKEEKVEVKETKKEPENVVEEARPLAEKKRDKVKESEFAINVKDHLGSREIEVLQVLSEKKKEFEARIRADTIFGKQEYYLVAKDKKNVNDSDLSFALQKAKSENLPAVFMASGDLNKKGKSHLEQWGNLVKFEKLKD